MRNLIVCCDGTWNTPDEAKGGVLCPTNVVKLYHALVTDDTQLAYYHPGVGTGEGWWDKVVGGGTGAGLDRNTTSAYVWLARTYQPLDRIFLFGFSRGAYTARSCAGLVGKYGLLDLSVAKPADAWDRAEKLFSAYRDKRAFDGKGCKFHNKAGGGEGTTPVYFVGVWDTVGALGIPSDFALLGLFDDPDKYRFHDTNLSKSVAFARHAVALDERRASFAPTFWTNIDEKKTDAVQLWFPGVHSDVGGGYTESGLSDGALTWMMQEAETCGLRFYPGWAKQLAPDALAPLHDSCTGIFNFLKSRPRSVPSLDIAADLHQSTRDRLATPTLRQGIYWPRVKLMAGESRTIDVFARSRWNATGIYLEAGVEYAFSAVGEWLDHTDPFPPDGAKKDFRFGDLARYASSLLGGVEYLYKKLRHSPDIDFWWTRRVEEANWFELIGFVANDVSVGTEELPEGQIFRIGKAARFKPKNGGYLYAFANDAWQTYDNNRGSVTLTVKQA